MAGEVERLSGKLGLDTTDFKTAVRGADREIRVLQSSFRASAAALVDWTKDATGLENRVKTLTGQIDIQKLKVAALAAEHKRLAAENGENSIAAQEAEIKLNKETETLNKMELELKQTESALGEMAQAEEETGEAAERMGNDFATSMGKAENLRDTINDFGGRVATVAVAGLAALAAAAVTAGLALGGLVFNAADAAGELVDLSLQTGISTDRLQEMAYAGDQLGTSAETITGSMARLVRSMSTAQEKQAKFNEELAAGKEFDDSELESRLTAFQKLGVSVEDSTGQLRDSQAVFADTIDALGRITNPTLRDALAMEIFGKSAQELNPLIKAGSAELARLAQEAHAVGAVVAEEDVAALEAFGDTMGSIQAAIKGMLGTLAADLVPIFQEVASSLQELFKSEDFKNRVKEITEIVKDFAAVAVDVIKDLVSGDVEGALARIFGADQASQLVDLFNTVKTFMQEILIPFLKEHGVTLIKVLAAIAAGFAAFSIITTVVGWITGLVGVVTSLAGVFTAAGGGIAGVVAILGGPVTLVIAAIAAAIALLTAAWTNNWGGIRDIVTGIWENNLKPMFEALGEWLSVAIPAAIAGLSAYWTETLLPAIQAVWAFLNDYIFPLFQAIGDFIGAVFNLYLKASAGLWQNVLLPALQGIYQFLENNVFPIFRAIGDYISNTFQPILEFLASFISSNLAPAFDGIVSAIQTATDWISNMADAINNLQLPEWLTPGSPTPWEIGLIGINNAMHDLNNQLPQMARNLDRLSFGGAGGFGAPSGGSVQNDQFQFFAPVIVQDVKPAGFGSQLKGRRF